MRDVRAAHVAAHTRRRAMIGTSPVSSSAIQRPLDLARRAPAAGDCAVNGSSGALGIGGLPREEQAAAQRPGQLRGGPAASDHLIAVGTSCVRVAIPVVMPRSQQHFSSRVALTCSCEARDRTARRDSSASGSADNAAAREPPHHPVISGTRSG